MEEVWKEVPGHPGYEVSDSGRVRSIDRTIVCANGAKKTLIGRQLSRFNDGKGYLVVSLGRGNRMYVHRAVLSTFKGCPDASLEACHNNGIPTDNRVDNLRWDTHKGNHKDRVAHGTNNAGEDNGASKLFPNQVLEIRDDSRTYRVIASDYGISISRVCYIKKKINWRHI